MPLQANPVNYCKLFNLPPPNWQYHPLAGHFGTERCDYCAERATTVDTVPNLHLNNPRSAHKLREVWLIDACSDCRECAERSGEPVPAKRRHAVLLALRTRQQHTRGPKSSMVRRRLERRIINLTARINTGKCILF